MRNFFVINTKLPSLNEVINENRANRFKGAKLKAQTEQTIQTYILMARSKKTLYAPLKAVEIHIEWHEATKRRDVDNIQSSKKFILDALVKSGILKDDSRKFVKQIHDIIVDDTKDYVIVELKEVEKCPM